MPRYRAVAIIINNERLLVTKRDNHGHHYYALPGGGIDPGETAAQAVVREIKEEAMFDCTVERQLYEHRYDNGEKHFFFLCRVKNPGEPKLAPDSVEVLNHDPNDTIEPMWLDLDKLPSTLLYPLEIRDWLLEDLEQGFKPQVRTANIKIRELRETL